MLIPDIIEQHWEEAALLWERRRAAVKKPSFSLATIGELDERIEAHLDGLRIAGSEGWQLCTKDAVWEDSGDAFVAGVLSFEGTDQARVDDVFKRMVPLPKMSDGLISALGWINDAAAGNWIQQALASPRPELRRIGIGAMAVRRLNYDSPLAGALKDQDDEVRARACRAVGELGRVDFVPALLAGAEQGSDVCKFWASWSAALLTGEPGMLGRLSKFVAAPSPYQERATQLWFRRQEPRQASEFQRELARQTELARLSISAAAIIGDPASVPWLLQQMENPAMRRLAGDAFQTITGADFVMERMRMNSPPRPEVAEDRGVDASPDLDGDLVWPEPKAINRWWEKRRSDFTLGRRYLLGKPINGESLHEVLRNGQQHQREAAALELAISKPGAGLFNLAFPASQQRMKLSSPGVATPRA